MAQNSSFFNAVETSKGVFDRTYNAEQWAEYFSAFIGNGVFAVPSANLQVNAGSGMQILINIGMAFINGYYYNSDSVIQMTLNPSNGTYARITNIVIELDLVNREIIAKAIDGTPSPTPVAPALIQNSSTWQICIAQITIPASAASINTGNITDTRLINDLCGVVASTVQQLDTSTLYQQWQAGFENWFDSIQSQITATDLGNLQQISQSIPTIQNNIDTINQSINSIQTSFNQSINLAGNSNYGPNGISSSNYQFGNESTMYLEAGTVYTLTGMASNTMPNEYCETWIDLFSENWKQNPVLSFKSQTPTINSLTFTAEYTGIYNVQLYSTVTANVPSGVGTVYWYTVQEGNNPACMWVPSPADAFDSDISNAAAKNFVRVLTNSEFGINSNDDLNNLINTGIYFTTPNCNCGSIQNTPSGEEGYDFYVEVLNLNHKPNFTTGFVYQKLVSRVDGIYYRCYYAQGGSWTPWWGVSMAQATSEEIALLGKSVSYLALNTARLKEQNQLLGKQVVNLNIQNAISNEQTNKLKSENQLLGKQIVDLSIQSAVAHQEASKLKNENNLLGKQVTSLTLNSLDVNNKIKILAQSVIQTQLNKQLKENK